MHLPKGIGKAPAYSRQRRFCIRREARPEEGAALGKYKRARGYPKGEATSTSAGYAQEFKLSHYRRLGKVEPGKVPRFRYPLSELETGGFELGQEGSEEATIASYRQDIPVDPAESVLRSL